MRAQSKLVPILVALAACRGVDEPADAEPSAIPVVVGSATSATSSSSGTTTGAGGGATTSLDVRLGTWNLHNFSKWGITEYRISDIAAEVRELDADVLGVQELKVAEDTNGTPPQAWDVLLDELDGYEGIHAPWDTFDTTVGLLYKRDTTELLDQRVLFEDDGYAFPRPPLEATVSIHDTEMGDAEELTLIVLHLKAFGDSVERRRAACTKLHTYLSSTPDAQVVLLGDLNDDPHDPPADNAFVGTFLDAEPAFHFVTGSLPPETVTSLGYYHWVDGMQIDGEFLDHFILSGSAMSAFVSATPRIASVPMAERATYEDEVSDHFPVLLDLVR